MNLFIKNFIFVFSSTLISCSTVYYSFWETLGKEKRDLLKSNVEKVKTNQDDIQTEYKDILERIRNEYKFEGGELEKTYDSLSSDYENARFQADALSSRIDRVESIAEDLFDEWQQEAEGFSNMTYKRDSLKKRAKTMKQFDRLLKSMRKVESSLQPVLSKLKDQVLYLKHNLNARALGAFKTEFKQITSEITKLNSEISKSSAAADQFIKTLN